MSGISDGLWKSYVGRKVNVDGKGAGTLLYFGITASTKASGIRKCGIELEAMCGKHDGKVNGQRYFTCEKGHGIITAVENVTMLEERTATGGKILRKRGKGGGSSASTPSRTPKKTPKRTPSRTTPSTSARKAIIRKKEEEQDNEVSDEPEDSDEPDDDEEVEDEPVNRKLDTAADAEAEEAVARAEARKEELRQIKLKLAAAEAEAAERATAAQEAKEAEAAKAAAAVVVAESPAPTPAAVVETPAPTTPPKTETPADDMKARAAASYAAMKEQAAQIANQSASTPSEPAAPMKRLARALGDFAPTKDDHLALKTGEIVEIVDSTKRWWIVFNSSKAQGRVPSNFLKELDADTLLKAKALRDAKAAEQKLLSPTPVAPQTPTPATPAQPTTPAVVNTPSAPQPGVTYVLAKADFNGKVEKGQLTMKKGDRFEVVDDTKNWWVVRKSTGEEGKVPSNYVDKI